ncbi:MAG: zeta toxin family protein [Ginsengibacter sp.]
MPQKRMRVFAGPNGSGKTTLINKLKDLVQFGIYVNADDIEKTISELGFLPLDDFKILLTTQQVQSYFEQSEFSPKKLNTPDLWKSFTIQDNKLFLTEAVNSYIAADIANFLREELLNAEISFSYETVMSHSSKVEFLKKAQKKNYKIYLYFIATDDPEINISRVKIRIAQKGHSVNPETIKKRYYKSLENLKSAIILSNRAFVFDNSGEIAKLIAEICGGNEMKEFDKETLPNWFEKFLLK